MATQTRPNDRQAIATMGSAGSPGLLDIDAHVFAEKFDKAPFLIGHRLCDHPLFELKRLLELGQALPAKSVEYNAGELPVGCDPAQTPRNGLSVEETIERIETCKSWMGLKNVEQDTEYGGLLARCLEEVARHSEAAHPGMGQREAFIFLSSPGSITPYHMDPEHNFLLQIQGTKTMTVFDRGVVTATELERFHSGAHRNMTFRDDYLARSTSFELLPGQAIHVPSAMPHFVRNGTGVSISFSITFRTPDLGKAGYVHSFNRLMRKAGLTPGEFGTHPGRDTVKSLMWRAIQRSRRMLGRDH